MLRKLFVFFVTDELVPSAPTSNYNKEKSSARLITQRISQRGSVLSTRTYFRPALDYKALVNLPVNR